MWTETLLLVLIIGGVLLLMLGSVTLTLWLSKKKLSQETESKYPELLNLLQTIEISNVDFVRNKIVLDLVDVYSFPAEQLQQHGAKGVSIVGNRIKFYVDGTAIDNENLYIEIQKLFKGE